MTGDLLIWSHLGTKILLELLKKQPLFQKMTNQNDASQGMRGRTPNYIKYK